MVFHIQNVVGQIATAAVDHINHVDLRICQHRQHMPQHTRHVLVRERDAGCALRARHAHGRKVHRIDHIAVLQKVHELVGRHHGAVLFGLGRAGANVRHGDDLVVVEQAGLGKIAHIAAELARGQRLQHGVFVHNAFARKVQQYRARLGHAQCFCIDHVAGRIQRRHVQRDIVSARQQAVQVLHTLHLVGQAPCCFDRQGGVEADDIHAHGQRRGGYQRTDGTQAHNAQCFAAQLATGKAGFFFLQQFGHFARIGHAVQRLGISNAGQHVAGGQQHAGQHQLFHRIGIGAGRIEHGDAALAVFINRNIVHARTCARSGQQGFGHGLAVQFLAAQQIGIGVGHIAAYLEVLARKAIQPFDGNGVVGSDFVHGKCPCEKQMPPGTRA